MLKKLLRKLHRSRFPYSPLITVTVFKDHILQNLAEFQKLNSGAPVAPVLKSNAYGHGLIQVATILDADEKHTAHIPFLIVDSYFEALTLRNEGIKKPLLIIGYTPADTILKNRLKDIAFSIVSMQTLSVLEEKATSPILTHLKIDTGMSRQGIQVEELDAALTLVKASAHISLEGVFSHFADADNTDPSFTNKQISTWNLCVQKVLLEFPTLPYYHISASAGHVYTTKVRANISRLGLGLYGIRQNAPIDSHVNLHPALQIKTVVSSVKTLEPGERVGYNGTYTTNKKMKIATIPVGYFEAVDRRLSNNGFVKIGNHFAPIIGRVSMNITTVDVTSIPNVAVDDEVIVISNNRNDKNSVENIAKYCNTIPYEILVHIPMHLLRAVH